MANMDRGNPVGWQKATGAGSSADPFVPSSDGDPATYAVAVTPNDGADLAAAARSLYVGGAGDVKVTTTGGDAVTFVAVPAGSILPVRVARVWSTGTSATSIVALR